MRRFRRTRVLHVIPTLGVGGAEQMAVYLMSGLSPSHDVFAVTLSPQTGSPIETALYNADIPVWHLGKRKGLDPRMIPMLDEVVQRVHPNVIHTHQSVLHYLLPTLLWRRAPVVVHTLHNVAERETDALGKMIRRLVFRRMVQPIAICEEVSQSVKRLYGFECGSIIPNGIPVERYRRDGPRRVLWRRQQGFDDNAFLYICVGRLEPQKNPLLLVRAFAAIKDPRAHLLLVGGGALQKQVEELIGNENLHGRVHLLGKRNDVVDCLGASDVFVFSSDWEGHPLAVMEAMAAGLPVVSTAVGGVPELVTSGVHGILVPPGNQEMLASAMQFLLSDPDKCADLSRAAAGRACAEFTVEQMVSRYAELYESALNRKARTPLYNRSSRASRGVPVEDRLRPR